MAQRFLPAVTKGDKRIFLVDGEPMEAVNHKQKEGGFRSNLAVDRHSEATEFMERERLICDALASALRSQSLFFVGIDVIGGMFSEINVTSSTGIHEVERLMNVQLADMVIDCLTRFSWPEPSWLE